MTQTCHACPAQWSIVTSDGRALYVRYRYGRLTVSAEDSEGFPIGELLHEEQCGGEYDGDMSTDEMLRRIAGVLGGVA